MSEELLVAIVEGLLNWPFLFIVLAIFLVSRYKTTIETWTRKISEVKLGKDSLTFKIGIDEVPIAKLDETITARLRELQVQIDTLKQPNVTAVEQLNSEHSDSQNDIPSALQIILIDRVYPMLRSHYWLGRYVKTLAKACAVSEETMVEFCKSRDDIGLFKDGDKLVAALKSRLESKE